MLNELVEKIEVYHSVKTNGVQTQNITIHFNCIGSIEIPDEINLELPEISLNTRKGVAVSYTSK